MPFRRPNIKISGMKINRLAGNILFLATIVAVILYLYHQDKVSSDKEYRASVDESMMYEATKHCGNLDNVETANKVMDCVVDMEKKIKSECKVEREHWLSLEVEDNDTSYQNCINLRSLQSSQ